MRRAAAGVRLQRQLDLPVGPGFNMLQETGCQVARTSLAWRGVEADPDTYNWHGSDVLYENLLDRGIRPLWVLVDAPCWSQADPQACTNGKGNFTRTPTTTTSLRSSRCGCEALSRCHRLRGLERAQLPRLLGWPAGAQRVLKDAEDRRRRAASTGTGHHGHQRRPVAALRQRHQRIHRLPRLPHLDVRKRRRRLGRRDRDPPVSGRRAERGLRQRRARLPRQDPKRG